MHYISSGVKHATGPIKIYFSTPSMAENYRLQGSRSRSAKKFRNWIISRSLFHEQLGSQCLLGLDVILITLKKCFYGCLVPIIDDSKQSKLWHNWNTWFGKIFETVGAYRSKSILKCFLTKWIVKYFTSCANGSCSVEWGGRLAEIQEVNIITKSFAQILPLSMPSTFNFVCAILV